MYLRLLITSFLICFSIVLSIQAKPSLLLMDADTGEEIIAVNASIERFPASLTKMMTLYIVFDHLKNSHLSLDEPVYFSPNASKAPSSKLYIPPGNHLTLNNCISAVAVKSANDVALAIAEKISGSENEFTYLMNQKAQELGMRNTVFYNASGLPHHQQVTTARDIAKLAQALIQDHGDYYYFFSMHFFQHKNRHYKNTNTLLGKVDGVDGIKTGYTRAAGWNLVTSQIVDGRRLIGVVMGELSSARRDYAMRQLLNAQIPTFEQIKAAEKQVRIKKAKKNMLMQWAIQTGVFKNKKQARDFALHLNKKHSNLFKKKNMFQKLTNVIRKSSHYKAQLGQFKTQKEAENACKTVQGKFSKCQVVKI